MLAAAGGTERLFFAAFWGNCTHARFFCERIPYIFSKSLDELRKKVYNIENKPCTDSVERCFDCREKNSGKNHVEGVCVIRHSVMHYEKYPVCRIRMCSVY